MFESSPCVELITYSYQFDDVTRSRGWNKFRGLRVVHNEIPLQVPVTLPPRAPPNLLVSLQATYPGNAVFVLLLC